MFNHAQIDAKVRCLEKFGHITYLRKTIRIMKSGWASSSCLCNKWLHGWCSYFCWQMIWRVWDYWNLLQLTHELSLEWLLPIITTIQPYSGKDFYMREQHIQVWKKVSSSTDCIRSNLHRSLGYIHKQLLLQIQKIYKDKRVWLGNTDQKIMSLNPTITKLTLLGSCL